MPVAIAVKRVGPNKPNTGTKYTKAGMVCPASINGLKNESARLLLPTQIPSETPTNIVSNVATIVCVSVTIASNQSPVATINISNVKVSIAIRTPPKTSATMTNIDNVMNQGDRAKTSSIGLSTQIEMKSLKPTVANETSFTK